jgi:predicted DNA-binding transcriptional regulator YafY
MPRNAEVIRQWNLLRFVEAARYGRTPKEMADELGVHVRTIYRDLEALQEVGFPLTNESRDGHTHWTLSASPFKHLEALGFSLSELCALYLSRRMLEALTGIPFQTALSDAFGKFERDLPEQMREYLNKLPSVVNALPAPGKPKTHPGKDQFAERLVNASLERRQVRMRYFSLSHEREGEYVVWPIRIIYMQGALYLRAWVPAYSEIRTFATHRIKSLSVLEERFTPSPLWKEDSFSTSLGPNDGKAIHVVLRFEPPLARLVRERSYHPSQATKLLPDGSLRFEIDVCDDAWLRSFILQFGHRVRVVAPRELADTVVEELALTQQHYAAEASVDSIAASAAMLELTAQWKLPFEHS